MKNMKIGKRLIVAFIVVAIVASIAGVIGAALLVKSDADYSHALENYGFSQGKIGRLGMEFNASRAFIRDIIFVTDPVLLQEAYDRVQNNIKKVNEEIELVRPTNISDEAKAFFQKFEDGLAEYRGYRDQVIELGMANNQDEAYRVWMEEAFPRVNALEQMLQELLQMNLDAGTKVTNELSTQTQITMYILVGVIIVGLVIAVIFGLFVSKGISRPITEVENAAKKMSEGNFDVNLAYKSKDEIGSLSDSMRSMIDTTRGVILDTSRVLEEVAGGNFVVKTDANYIGIFAQIKKSIDKIVTDLDDTLMQIKMSCDQVTAGSGQVSAAAQSLAQGTTQQASSIEELSASISEISSQVSSNADNANQANESALTVGDKINLCNEQMQQLKVAMGEISDSSSQISKIIKAIEDIAFQTNILALNAAVEAARAGAAGKGFAVVADEVRSLATKSSEAAKQTNNLIENSVIAVDKGMEITDGTASTLSEVVTGATSITGLIQQIAAASSEQSLAITQINSGVEQISVVIQTNSATSQESAAASQELSSQANLMKEAVSKFKLKQETKSEYNAYPNGAIDSSIDFSMAGPTDKY